MSVEAEVFLVGNWKNFEEIEENLTLAELEAILEATRRVEKEKQRFAAALKGIKLDDESSEELTGDDIARRAAAKLAGISEEQFELGELGIAVISEQEDEIT